MHVLVMDARVRGGVVSLIVVLLDTDRNIVHGTMEVLGFMCHFEAACDLGGRFNIFSEK